MAGWGDATGGTQPQPEAPGWSVSLTAVRAFVDRTIDRARSEGRLAFGRLTASGRPLPDFVVIGVQRAGTTSLYRDLKQHPQVMGAATKEVHYFDYNHAKGLGWYRAHFPLAIRRRIARRRRRPWLTFEATPDYLFDPRVPARVKVLLPDVKLIVILRDPVARAVSHYHHMVRHGHEPMGLAEALHAEDERLDGAYREVIDHPDSRALALRRHSYVGRGRYAEQLQRWRALFPAEQMMIVRSADLFDATGDTFGRILDFLGLPRWQPEEFRNYSYRNPFEGGYPAPTEEVTAFLNERFAEPNRRLVDLLGEGFGWDSRVRP